jgi:4-alpha-glucanotransferase
MFNERAAGVLCHISSLPSPYGIGDLGPEAYKFVDILAQAGQKYWQVLPLNLTDVAFGNSPYSSFSAFAFNVLFISPDLLAEDGLIDKDYLKTLRDDVITDVDYDAALRLKEQVLSKAWEAYCARKIRLRSFESFCQQEKHWLHDFARFVVLRQRFDRALWTLWPVAFRDRDQSVLEAFDKEFVLKIEESKFR